MSSQLKNKYFISLAIYLCCVVLLIYYTNHIIHLFSKSYDEGKFLSLYSDNKLAKLNDILLKEYFEIIRKNYSVLSLYCKISFSLYIFHNLALIFFIKKLWIHVKRNQLLLLALLGLFLFNVYLSLQALYFQNCISEENQSMLSLINFNNMSFLELKSYILNLDTYFVKLFKKIINYKMLGTFNIILNIIILTQSIFLFQKIKNKPTSEPQP